MEMEMQFCDINLDEKTLLNENNVEVLGGEHKNNNNKGEKECKEEEEEEEEEEKKERKGYNGDKPPEDDCCPICFGVFKVPCKANCGHWFCGSCILQFWKYRSRPRRCKCPFCSSAISNFTPESCLVNETELDVLDVLENIERYNHFYVKGLKGSLLILGFYLQKHGPLLHLYIWSLLRALVVTVITSPIFLIKVFVDLIRHPERLSFNFQQVRLIACTLSLLSHLYHGFLQPGYSRLQMTKIRLYIDCASITLVVLPYALIMCTTWIHILWLRFRIWQVRREVNALRAHNAALREQESALRENADALRRQEVALEENAVLVEQNDIAPKSASGVSREQQYKPASQDPEASSPEEADTLLSEADFTLHSSR